jgi:hypothetical protein
MSTARPHLCFLCAHGMDVIWYHVPALSQGPQIVCLCTWCLVNFLWCRHAPAAACVSFYGGRRRRWPSHHQICLGLATHGKKYTSVLAESSPSASQCHDQSLECEGVAPYQRTVALAVLPSPGHLCRSLPCSTEDAWPWGYWAQSQPSRPNLSPAHRPRLCLLRSSCPCHRLKVVGRRTPRMTLAAPCQWPLTTLRWWAPYPSLALDLPQAPRVRRHRVRTPRGLML